jgi:hypothetical protein
MGGRGSTHSGKRAGKPLGFASPSKKKGKAVPTKEKRGKFKIMTAFCFGPLTFHMISYLQIQIFYFSTTGNQKISVGAGPQPFCFEWATFTSSADDKDGFVHGIRLQVNGHAPSVHERMATLNLTKVDIRREPHSANVPMKNPDDYYRYIIVRYPNEGESTAETRAYFLEVLEDFLKDPKYSKYPPKDIDKVDLVKDDNFIPLDMYFMDETIKDLMVEDIPAEDLTPEFAMKYPDFAKLCWKGPHISDWGKSLGIGENPDTTDDDA